MNSLFIGTSGYNYKDWKEQFYPQGLPQKKWLSFYAEHFRTVEINATFYGSFTGKTFHNWAAQVPSNFSFTIKGPRFITHIKRLHEVDDPLERFFGAAVGLGDKLSCVLWQLPGNFHNRKPEDVERLREFIALLPQHVRHAVELRHASWFKEEVLEILNSNNVGFVINNSSRYPWVEKVTGGFVYVRFHGPRELYASEYGETEMKDWAEKIRGYIKSSLKLF